MRRPAVLGAALWVVAVTIIALTLWSVVDRVVQLGGGSVSAAAPRPTLPLTSSTLTTSAPPQPSASPARTPSSAATPTRPVPPSRTPSTPATPRPPERSSTPDPAPSPEPSPTPAVTRTFTSDGGSIQVTCTLGGLRVDAIRPRDGWSFRREAEEGELEVKFTRAEEEDEVKVRCRSGVPVRDD